MWSLQNFAHERRPAIEIQQGKISIESELGTTKKNISENGP